MEKTKQIGLYIRVWQEPRELNGESAEWRASVDSIRDDQRRYFKDVESLLSFLHDHLENLHLEGNAVRRYLE